MSAIFFIDQNGTERELTEREARAAVESGRLFRARRGKVYLFSLEDEEAIRADWVNQTEKLAMATLHQDLERKRGLAVTVLEERMLAEAASDPDAPAEVKDYAALISGGT